MNNLKDADFYATFPPTLKKDEKSKKEIDNSGAAVSKSSGSSVQEAGKKR